MSTKMSVAALAPVFEEAGEEGAVGERDDAGMRQQQQQQQQQQQLEELVAAKRILRIGSDGGEGSSPAEPDDNGLEHLAQGELEQLQRCELSPYESEDNNEQAVLEKTSAFQEKECRWLLLGELPRAFMDIGIALTEALQLLTGTSDWKKTAHRPATVPISSPAGVLRGEVMVNGTQIIKAAIECGSDADRKKAKGAPWVQTEIAPEHPTLLPAAHMCLIACQRAYRTLEEHLAEQQYGYKPSPANALRFLKELQGQLQTAKECLSSNNSPSPEASFRQMQPYIPKLPEDTILQLYIVMGHVIVRYARVKKVANPEERRGKKKKKHQTVLKHSSDSDSILHQQFAANSTWFTVTHEELGVCEIPSISRSLRLLHKAQRILQNITDQVATVSTLCDHAFLNTPLLADA